MNIKVNGINLFYEVTGKGRPVVLLHGNGETHKIFDVLVARLAAEYSCYAIDSRCHGKSDKGELTYVNMAADTAAFIDALHLDKPLIIGFSDGGIIALLLAINYGTKIGKIIALGPNATPDGLQPKFIKFLKIIYAVSRSKKIEMLLKEPNITSSQLKKIKTPTVIIGGERDIIRAEHLRYIAENVPQSQLEIIAGESHESYVIHSPKLYGIIAKYL